MILFFFFPPQFSIFWSLFAPISLRCLSNRRLLARFKLRLKALNAASKGLNRAFPPPPRFPRLDFVLFLLRFASRQRKLGKLGAGGASLLLRAGNGQQGAGKSGSFHLETLVFPWHPWNLSGNLVSRCSQGVLNPSFPGF